MTFSYNRRTNATKGYKRKPECIKGTLDPKDFEKLTGTVTVQLTNNVRNGYFISYPNYKDNEGEYHDLAYCFDRDVIDGLTALVIEMIDGK